MKGVRQGIGGGPKPKPTYLKLIAGNPGRRPLNDSEPKPKASIPRPPPELSSDALKEWKKISRQLFAAGILTVVDRAVLAAYCQAYGRWVQAERALAGVEQQGAGLLIRTTKGHLIQHPLLGVANRAMSDMVRYALEFGMTPSSRSRVRANLNGQSDPADDFFAS